MAQMHPLLSDEDAAALAAALTDANAVLVAACEQFIQEFTETMRPFFDQVSAAMDEWSRRES